MRRTTEDSVQELARKVKSTFWYHSIDLGHGIVTPGHCGPPNPDILRLYDTLDFRGKKVLDIGCWDGLWSFEAEKRGAALVYATDKVDHRTYNESLSIHIAHEALKSKVVYRSDLSVYDVGELGVNDFDIVVFCGVFYHLKDPLLALARLRRVMKEGGTILIEGEVHPDETRALAKFYYRDWLANDPSNWWVPSRRCLREWVECSYFEIVNEFIPEEQFTERFLTRSGTMLPDEHHLRVYLAARAVRRRDGNYQGRDTELGRFDLAHGERHAENRGRPASKPHLWSRALRRLKAARTRPGPQD
jgi:tRNA (mo5U34)-methyltransferase